MKMLIVAIVVVVAIAIGYPLLNEGPSVMCDALEKRLIALESRKSDNQAETTFLVALQRALSNGSLAMSIVKQQHPHLPPVVGCMLTYWQTVLNPAGEEERMIEQLKSAAADDAQRARALDAEKAMRALTSPAAPLSVKAGQERAPAYKTGDRREMDRLIANPR